MDFNEALEDEDLLFLDNAPVMPGYPQYPQHFFEQ